MSCAANVGLALGRIVLWVALVLSVALGPGVLAQTQEAPETLPMLPPSGDEASVSPATARADSATASKPGAGSPHDLLVRGNALYEEGHFAEAAHAYQTALAYGIENEVLHYNLGNALFRMDRLGPAILEYERALLLSPGDDDIRANLAFARAHASDAAPPAAEGPVAILKRWLQRPGINGSAVAALLVYLVGALLVGLALLLRTQRRALLWAGAVAAFLLAVPPALVVATQALAREADARAVVMAERVECRSGPGDFNPVLFTVHEGTTVQVIDQREGWVRIALPDGLNGWMPEGTLERVRSSGHHGGAPLG